MAYSPMVRKESLTTVFVANTYFLRIYPAEIFPLAVRARGNAFGVVGWSIGNGWLVSHCSLIASMDTGDIY